MPNYPWPVNPWMMQCQACGACVYIPGPGSGIPQLTHRVEAETLETFGVSRIETTTLWIICCRCGFRWTSETYRAAIQRRLKEEQTTLYDKDPFEPDVSVEPPAGVPLENDSAHRPVPWRWLAAILLAGVLVGRAVEELIRWMAR